MDRDRWLQIEEIYNAAVELRPEDRKIFIEKSCAGDSSLRKEVECLFENQSRLRTSGLSKAASGMVMLKGLRYSAIEVTLLPV